MEPAGTHKYLTVRIKYGRYSVVPESITKSRHDDAVCVAPPGR